MRKKVNKKFNARTKYLAHRVQELGERVKKNTAHIVRLHGAMLGDISVVLHRDHDDPDQDVVASGGAAAGAGPARSEETTPAVSDAQRVRLGHQAMGTVEVLQRQNDRDQLQLHQFEAALRVYSAAEADTARTPAVQKATEAEVWKHLNEASLIRLINALLHIAKSLEPGFIDKQ